TTEGGLQTREPRGLFDIEPTLEDGARGEEALFAEALTRVERGDLSALNEVWRAGRADEYRSLLNLVVQQCGDDELSTLVAYISNSRELRESNAMTQRLLEAFRCFPSEKRATEMLHIAALSDDAKSYHEAVDLLLETWRSGKVTRLSSRDLKELLESQFWVL